MISRVFSTPRPVPSRRWPLVAGAAVIALALPVTLAAGAPLAGWVLGAVLWAAGELLTTLLARLPLGADNLATSGMRGVATTFKGIAVMAVLIAVTLADEAVGVTAALAYVAAYTLELAVSLVAYFGASR